jgi:ABC-2 type transport system permease protein
MRALVAGQGFDTATLFVSIALAALYVLLACVIFAAVHRYTVRSGLLARYSAESVS